VSYRSNRAYVDEVERQAALVEKEVGGLSAQNLALAATLPPLDAARAIPGRAGDREARIPWSSRFGLYQGKKLGRGAEDTYQGLLQDVLLPRVVLRVENQVRNGPNDPDFLLEGLRVYRMLGEGAHLEPETVQAWVQLDLETSPGDLSPDDRQRLENHLKALLEKPPAPAKIALDGGLIRQTQRTLRAAPLAERAYARLKRRPAEGVKPFTIADAAGKDAPLVFARRSGTPLTEGVPGLYTRPAPATSASSSAAAAS
jgi:type VI secretion system protein ImpL